MFQQHRDIKASNATTDHPQNQHIGATVESQMSVLHWIRGQVSVSGPISTGTCMITCEHGSVRRKFDDARLEIRDATGRYETSILENIPGHDIPIGEGNDARQK